MTNDEILLKALELLNEIGHTWLDNGQSVMVYEAYAKLEQVANELLGPLEEEDEQEIDLVDYYDGDVVAAAIDYSEGRNHLQYPLHQ